MSNATTAVARLQEIEDARASLPQQEDQFATAMAFFNDATSAMQELRASTIAAVNSQIPDDGRNTTEAEVLLTKGGNAAGTETEEAAALAVAHHLEHSLDGDGDDAVGVTETSEEKPKFDGNRLYWSPIGGSFLLLCCLPCTIAVLLSAVLHSFSSYAIHVGLRSLCPTVNAFE